MSGGSALWDNEWIKVGNGRSLLLPSPKPCSLCKAGKCAPVWYSISTKEIRCQACFTPSGY